MRQIFLVGPYQIDEDVRPLGANSVDRTPQGAADSANGVAEADLDSQMLQPGFRGERDRAAGELFRSQQRFCVSQQSARGGGWMKVVVDAPEQRQAEVLAQHLQTGAEGGNR